MMRVGYDYVVQGLANWLYHRKMEQNEQQVDGNALGSTASACFYALGRWSLLLGGPSPRTRHTMAKC